MPVNIDVLRRCQVPRVELAERGAGHQLIHDARLFAVAYTLEGI
jgi:hypothetical protein